MSLLSRLLRPAADPASSIRPLWHRVVEIAREREWFARGGIADTVAGRFDSITLVLAAVILRMERDPALGNAAVHLTELFVEDMDGQLRESGVGDLMVGKHMGKLMSVLGGRLGALREGLAMADDAALTAAIERNVTLGENADPAWIAAHLRALSAQLAGIDADSLLGAELSR